MITQHKVLTGMASELKALGGFLDCGACGRRESLGDVGTHLGSGWPKCCGHTMQWWTQRQIDDGDLPARSASA